ncbi:hypothetical protein BACFIN_08893 [Bacteroides finegoldii DSM 17565]|nr:hypothetical protein BACFIN_08893 [Bacteroides finegoldii DSM 17565]
MCFYFRLPPFWPSNRFLGECLKIQKRQLIRNEVVALNFPISGISPSNDLKRLSCFCFG